jgi:hypothetical protein
MDSFRRCGAERPDKQQHAGLRGRRISGGGGGGGFKGDHRIFAGSEVPRVRHTPIGIVPTNQDLPRLFEADALNAC